MPIAERKSYGNSLANMGFTHHNIIRIRRTNRDVSVRDRARNNPNLIYKANTSADTYSVVNDIKSEKLFSSQLDWYMQNLVKRSNIDFVWACIEPDIDKFTGAVDRSSNHVHFAYSGKHLSKNSLASYMRINRKYLRDTRSLTDSMSYFTKHIGKSLSYHNLYT